MNDQSLIEKIQQEINIANMNGNVHAERAYKRSLNIICQHEATYKESLQVQPSEIRFNEAEHGTRYRIGEKAIADCFPRSADPSGIYHLDSGNLQALVHTTIELYEREREPVSVSLEKCAEAAFNEAAFYYNANEQIQVELANSENVAKAVLDAAGVKYVD